MDFLEQKLKTTYKNFHKTIIIFRVIEDFLYLLASYTLFESIFYIHVAIFSVSLFIYFYITNVDYNIKLTTILGLSAIIIGTFIRSLFFFKYTLWINVPYLLCILALPVYFTRKETIYISLVVISCIILGPIVSYNHLIDIPVFNYTESLKINDYIAMVASIILILLSLKYNMRTIELKNELKKKNNFNHTSNTQNIINSKKIVLNNLENNLKGADFDEKLQEIYLKITIYFDEQKPFLDSKFNMQKLATEIQSNLNYVSKTMNLIDDGGFIGFVNKYRIKYILEEIQNENYKQFTLETMYKNAGFSHQSTFNRVFKQYLNNSPREYIKNVKKEKSEFVADN